VSATTVASFESVGAILVVALLIAPAATAYLLTDNLKWMMVIASISGIISSITGYYLAVWLDGSIAGAIATCAGILFGLALMFSPTHGLIFKKINALEVNTKPSN
jgi:manganese/zinc/iron transport system permease protein